MKYDTSACKEEKPMPANFKFNNKMTGDVFGTGKEMPLHRPEDKVNVKGTNMGKKD